MRRGAPGLALALAVFLAPADGASGRLLAARGPAQPSSPPVRLAADPNGPNGDAKNVQSDEVYHEDYPNDDGAKNATVTSEAYRQQQEKDRQRAAAEQAKIDEEKAKVAQERAEAQRQAAAAAAEDARLQAEKERLAAERAALEERLAAEKHLAAAEEQLAQE